MYNSAKLVLLVCTACNGILGLHDVDVRHRQFDAPTDASAQCPPFGQVPTYSTLVRQALLQDCVSYEVSRSGTAVGLCDLPNNRRFVGVGPAGQPLSATDIPIPMGLNTIQQARISPDGERILVAENVIPGGIFVHLYERTGDHWQQLGDLPVDPYSGPLISTIFSGPAGDAVFVRVLGQFVELWYQDGTWNPVPTTFTTPVALVADYSFTSDGVHGIVVSTSHLIFYTARMDTSSPFQTAVPITAPSFATASLSDDCSRIYTTGLGSIAYVDEQ